jgi:hypothetical protein
VSLQELLRLLILLHQASMPSCCSYFLHPTQPGLAIGWPGFFPASGFDHAALRVRFCPMQTPALPNVALPERK